jgi:hypothetical protein
MEAACRRGSAFARFGETGKPRPCLTKTKHIAFKAQASATLKSENYERY